VEEDVVELGVLELGKQGLGEEDGGAAEADGDRGGDSGGDQQTDGPSNAAGLHPGVEISEEGGVGGAGVAFEDSETAIAPGDASELEEARERPQREDDGGPIAGGELNATRARCGCDGLSRSDRDGDGAGVVRPDDWRRGRGRVVRLPRRDGGKEHGDGENRPPERMAGGGVGSAGEAEDEPDAGGDGSGLPERIEDGEQRMIHFDSSAIRCRMRWSSFSSSCSSSRRLRTRSSGELRKKRLTR
jgi:hypothetical protein